MAFDNFMKQLFKKISLNQAISGYSIGPREKQIDIVLQPREKVSKIEFLPSILKKKKHHYVIEFKSHGDVFKENDVAKTAMYKWGYCYTEKLPINLYKHLIGCMIITKKERWFTDAIQKGIFEKTKYQGIYKHAQGTIDYVIIINELKLLKENLGLLLNASNEKLKDVLHFMRTNHFIQNNILENYLYSKCFLLNESEDEELMAEVKKILQHKHEKSIRNAVNIIGLEKVIESVGLEKVIESVGLEKVIESVDDEEYLFKKVLNKIGKEKMKKMLSNQEDKK